MSSKKNAVQTSKVVASAASKALSGKATSKLTKALAASALVNAKKKTGKK
ncbi:hypothetical protein [Chromobacterium sp. ATCC 53434]|nr:hypothetical protein [Chromobacterium sp. ATCC 53434]